MKLSLFSAAPVLLLASSAAFAQVPAANPTPAPAAAADAPVTAAAPAPAPAIDVTTPAPPPLATPAELLPPPVPEVPLATKLGIGKEGWWQPGANLQFWIFGANQGGDTTTTLRIRRAELKIKGEIIPKLLAFTVMIDPARVLENNKSKLTVSDGGTGTVTVNNQGNVSILQDFGITVMSDYADVTAGQFKIPVSLEGSSSASKLLFPERAVVSRRFGDQRDLGIKVEKKLGKHFYYQAAVFNGEGQNKLDTNVQKDAAARIEVYPIDGIMVGFVGYTGVTNRETSPTKDRLEADFRLDLANVLLQAEYIHGWDGPTNQPTVRPESAGMYAVVGYTFMDKLQPVFRFGHYDPDVHQDLQGTNERTTLPTGDEVTTYELGLNYYLRGDNAKLQAAWSKYVYKNEPNRGELIIAAQAAF
jgi:hypothetical protein